MIALFAHALPAARTAAGEPAFSAKSEYDQVFQGAIFHMVFQAACENAAPGCLT